VLMNKRNLSKKYNGGKKTNDNLSQVVSKEGVN